MAWKFAAEKRPLAIGPSQFDRIKLNKKWSKLDRSTLNVMLDIETLLDLLLERWKLIEKSWKLVKNFKKDYYEFGPDQSKVDRKMFEFQSNENFKSFRIGVIKSWNWIKNLILTLLILLF